MGAIDFSVNHNLILALKAALPVSIFVETGTYKGDTSILASSYFEHIFTVEASYDLFIAARDRLQNFINVKPIYGNSPDVLQRLSVTLCDQSAVYWLDAHWSGSTTAGASFECPLIDEINAIGKLNSQSVILIDDARLFTAPPPPPHRAADWPGLDAVYRSLNHLSANHCTWIINDVIIFAPSNIAENIIKYGISHGFDLLDVHTRDRGDSSKPALNKDQLPKKDIIWENNNRPEYLFFKHLCRLNLARVLDIGSNTGQFAEKLRGLGYASMIYSIEPQKKYHTSLLANARKDPHWIILPRQGVGSSRQVSQLNISLNSYSSSLLPLHENHLSAEPGTRQINAESILINRTADIMAYHEMNCIDAVKIDVQGFEREVLLGLLPVIQNIQLLQVELSLVECYIGAPTLFELDAWITGELGFERISLEPSCYDKKRLIAQQYDGLYYKSNIESQGNPLGISLDAIFTSIGGSSSRINAKGENIGSTWLRLCSQSWAKHASLVISVSEVSPNLHGVQSIKVSERPLIAEILREIGLTVDGHSLLVNSDILLSDSFGEFCAKADPNIFYYGCRTEVINVESDKFEIKGVYMYGFDFFIFPPGFVRLVDKQNLFPSNYRIGDPWWDYALPILAMANGYTIKRLQVPGYALHCMHEARYSDDTFLTNGAHFLEWISDMRLHCEGPIIGLLDELLEVKEIVDPKARLGHLCRLVVEALP